MYIYAFSLTYQFGCIYGLIRVTCYSVVEDIQPMTALIVPSTFFHDFVVILKRRFQNYLYKFCNG